MLVAQPLAPKLPAPSPASSTEASVSEEVKRGKRRGSVKNLKAVQEKAEPGRGGKGPELGKAGKGSELGKGGKGSRRGRGRGDAGKGEDAEESWSRVDKGFKGKGGKNGKRAPSEVGEALGAAQVLLPVPLPPRLAKGAVPAPSPPVPTPAPEAARPRKAVAKAVPKAAPAETTLPKPNQRKAASRHLPPPCHSTIPARLFTYHASSPTLIVGYKASHRLPLQGPNQACPPTCPLSYGIPELPAPHISSALHSHVRPPWLGGHVGGHA